MKGKLPVLGAFGVMLLLTTGCASLLNPKPKDINEERGLGPNNSIQLGAASRSINTVEIRDDSLMGHVRPKRIVCAEPSPDVATTIAQSITASFNAAAKVDNPQGQAIAANAAGQFGQSSVQGAIQLGERLATVTLLRDSLHRACEAYANGAMTDMSYSLILSRYHATMVTMLNSELTAGAFGRELGALSGEAAHALGGLSDDIQAAQQSLQAAQLEVGAQTAEQSKADKKLKDLMDNEPQNEAEAAQKKKNVDAQKLEVGKQNRALADAKNKEFLAKADLDAARLRGASGKARIEATNVKGIKANVSGETGDKLLALTKQFNDSGIPEALLVACIASMDRPTQQGIMAETCRAYLAGLNKAVGEVAAAKVKIAGDEKLEAQRLTNDFQLRLAQIRAGVVGDVSRLCSSQSSPDDVRACIDEVKKVTANLTSSQPSGAIEVRSLAEVSGIERPGSIAAVPQNKPFTRPAPTTPNLSAPPKPIRTP